LVDAILALFAEQSTLPASEFRKGIVDAGHSYDGKPSRAARTYLQDAGQLRYDNSANEWVWTEPGKSKAPPDDS
jgi:hypothetical protein